jgi:hypothetical protein
MLLEKAVEAPDRGEGPGGAALGETSPLQLPQEAAEAEAVQRGPLPLAVVPVAELGEGLEIACVCLHRMGRDIALLLKVHQIFGDFTTSVH